MGRARVLIASSLWVAASFTPAWAAGPGEAQKGGDCFPFAFSRPYPFFLNEELGTSFNMDLKRLRPAPFQPSSSTVLDETVSELQGMKARYEIDLGNYSFEFSGGYVPAVKSLLLSESPLDSSGHLGYVNLTIPLSQFYLKGGTFFGQNVGAIGLILKRPFEEQNVKRRELFGYQVGGGYRFSDSLSIQAGWEQAAQEYEMTREALGSWYLQAQISLGRRMSVTPQVGFVDFTAGDGERIKEQNFYYGASWRINF